MLEGSIAFTLSGATNSKFKALFSVWLPDYDTGWCLEGVKNRVHLGMHGGPV